MKEFEVVLSYTFQVRTKDWYEAEKLGRQATMPLPDSIKHPQSDRRPVLHVDVGEGFEVKEVE